MIAVRSDDPRAFYVHPLGTPEIEGQVVTDTIVIGAHEAVCITGFRKVPRDCECGAVRLARLTDPPFTSAELPALKMAALAEISWDHAEWTVKRQPQRDTQLFPLLWPVYGWHIRLELADPRLSSPLVNAVAVLGTSPVEPGSSFFDAIRRLRTWAEEEVLRRLDLLPPEEPET